MTARTVNINKQGAIRWNTTIFMIIFHVASIAALFMLSWKAVPVAILLWWVSGSLGIGVGFHRLLTHRGLKVPKPVEYFLTFCGLLALEGGAINWVVTHRIHHSTTDQPGDPHTPRDGGWWAHMGWIFRGTAQQHEDEVLQRYAPDLMKDPIHRFMNRFYYMPLVLSGIVLMAIGGFPFVFVGVFLRTTIGLHMTWLVNSATHMWGSRRFDTRDDSTNSAWVALVTFGEGWHNNHHAHPRSARHGMAWYELDLNWYAIRVMQSLRIATNVRVIGKDQAIDGQRSSLRKAA
jgi:fatty-acid desaturase